MSLLKHSVQFHLIIDMPIHFLSLSYLAKVHIIPSHSLPAYPEVQHYNFHLRYQQFQIYMVVYLAIGKNYLFYSYVSIILIKNIIYVISPRFIIYNTYICWNPRFIYIFTVGINNNYRKI